MAAVEHLQFALWNQAMHQARVHQRYQRIIVAGENEYRLRQGAQPMHASPADQREQLQVITRARLPANILEVLLGEFGLAAEVAAIHVADIPARAKSLLR